jgi:hypothetical protein
MRLNLGTFVQFHLFVFGSQHIARGYTKPSITPKTVNVQWEIVLPPRDAIDPLFRKYYPERGILHGVSQIPIEHVQQVALTFEQLSLEL